jgi:hypothetical protein
MKAQSPKVIFDPYQWLPSYGEKGVEVSYKESKLELKILYNNKENNTDDFIKIEFFNVVYYSMSYFPGIDSTTIEYSKISDLSSLNEFESSDYSEKWSLSLGLDRKDLKHFILYFISANIRLEVIAKKVEFKETSKI